MGSLSKLLNSIRSFSKKQWALICLCSLAYFAFYVFALGSLQNQFLQKKIESFDEDRKKIVTLYQDAFYFHFLDQFKPQMAEILKKNPDLSQVIVFNRDSKKVLFDSQHPNEPLLEKFDWDALSATNEWFELHFETVAKNGKGLFEAIHSDGDINFVFTWHKPLLFKFSHYLAIALFLLSFGVIAWPRNKKQNWSFLYSLRTKLALLLIGVNFVGTGIIFFSLSFVQKKEQQEKLIRESIVFSEFSKESIAQDFSSYFYFYYQEKFVPSVQEILEANHNLVSIRIISSHNEDVLFDSQKPHAGADSFSKALGEVLGAKDKKHLPIDLDAGAQRKIAVSSQLREKLSNKEVFTEEATLSDASRGLRVVTAIRAEGGESSFWIEYLYSFLALEKSVHEIQKQILLDLVPALIFGLLIAIIFSQVILIPLRKLLAATHSIRRGDYDVRVHIKQKDELGELVNGFNAMASELKRKTELKKYLSQHTYQKVMESDSAIDLSAGSRVWATVLFCDIRNFTHICETLAAEEVTTLLNDYFSQMVQVIDAHKGEVDKFVGDGFLAVFYEENEVGPLNALYCAMEIKQKLKKFNERRRMQGQDHLEIGIGINRGELISGPIGSPDRMDFTVIGDVVNVAARIEKLSKSGQFTKIIFTQNVWEKVSDCVQAVELTREAVRGKEESIIVYELKELKGRDELFTQLKSDKPELRQHSAEVLGYSSDADVIPVLISCLDDASDQVRIAVVYAMARLSKKDQNNVIEAFLSRIQKESSVSVLSSLVNAMGMVCTTDDLLKLTPFLKNTDERLVSNTIETLAHAPTDAVVDLVMPYLASTHHRIKASAALALFMKGRIEVIQALTPMLVHSDALMRASAAFALGELSLRANTETFNTKLRKNPALYEKKIQSFLIEIQNSVSILISLLEDSNPIVKRQAVIALGKMKDRSAVIPLVKCVDPVKDSKELIRDVAEAVRSIGSHRLVREVVQYLG